MWYQIWKRRRPYCADNRAPRRISASAFHERQMVSGDLLSKGRAAKHSPLEALGIARCVKREVSLQQRGSRKHCQILDPDVGVVAGG